MLDWQFNKLALKLVKEEWEKAYQLEDGGC